MLPTESKRAILGGKRAISLSRGKRCFIPTEDGWVTVSRRPTNSAQATRLAKNGRRFPRHRAYSKFLSFFPSPNPSHLPLSQLKHSDDSEKPLTIAPKPPQAMTTRPNPSRHPLPRLPSLFIPLLPSLNPKPATTKEPHFPSFKQALLSQPTMVRNNHQLTAASAKAKTGLTAMRRAVAGLPKLPTQPREGWIGRCYRCLKVGHSRAECQALQPTCGRCRKTGHETNKCRSSAKTVPAELDPLTPTGNIGDSTMPTTRPEQISAFVPQTRDSYRDIRYLQRAVVVDARLWPAHDPAGVQARLMAAAGSDNPFELTDMGDNRYVMILPENLSRQQFLRDALATLETFSLVCYPWNARIGMVPVEYPFKVWLDLFGVPLMAWNMDHLIPMLAHVGLILDHTPFEHVKSISKMRVVVAVKELTKVPQAIDFAIRGLATDIKVQVAGWDYRITSVNLPADPTPPDSYFQEVQDKLFKQPLISAQPDTSAKMIPVDADVLFQWWEKLPEGEHKNGIEKMLRASPFWTVKEKRDLLDRLDSGNDTNSTLPVHQHLALTASKAVMRGSSSTAPAPPLLEHSTAAYSGVGSADPQNGKELMTVEVLLSDLPSPTPSQLNNSAHMAGLTDQQPPSAEYISFSGKAAKSQGPTAAVDHNALVERPNSTKRPAEPKANNIVAKRSLASALENPEALSSPAPHSNEITKALEAVTGKAKSTTAPALRRSSRPAKGNTKLSSFVVGSSARKARANKLKPNTVQEALTAAGLNRCLQAENLVQEPLSKDEQNKIRDFCAIVGPDPTPVEHNSESPQPLLLQFDRVNSIEEDDDLGERFTAMDESLSDDSLTDIDDEAERPEDH